MRAFVCWIQSCVSEHCLSTNFLILYQSWTSAKDKLENLNYQRTQGFENIERCIERFRAQVWQKIRSITDEIKDDEPYGGLYGCLAPLYMVYGSIDVTANILGVGQLAKPDWEGNSLRLVLNRVGQMEDWTTLISRTEIDNLEIKDDFDLASELAYEFQFLELESMTYGRIRPGELGLNYDDFKPTSPANRPVTTPAQPEATSANGENKVIREALADANWGCQIYRPKSSELLIWHGGGEWKHPIDNRLVHVSSHFENQTRKCVDHATGSIYIRTVPTNEDTYSKTSRQERNQSMGPNVKPT